MIIDESGNSPAKLRGVTISHNKRDGWYNVLSGLGKSNLDKTENTYYDDFPRFEDDELTRIYIGEGVGKKIVDLAADDTTRQWITVKNDDQNKITTKLETLGAESAINIALKWARLYRGSLIIMMTDTGTIEDMSQPMPVNAPITGLRVYSAARVYVDTTDIVSDPKSKYFDEVEIFRVRKRDGFYMNVHASRCMIFKGEPAPDEADVLDLKYRYWGVPVLQAIWSRLRNFGGIEKGVANLMMEFIVGKYKLSNLVQILSQNDPEALELIYNRIDIINASKSMINAVLLGEDEDYTRDAASIGGVSDIMDRFMILIAAVSGYPATRLWGRSPAGENATGESDITLYYDTIQSYQKNRLKMPLQELINRIALSEGLTGEYPVVFNPLWQPTEKEVAEVDKMNAETDNIYITTGVLTPEDVQQKRFPELGLE